jgi:branched-chain amino acid transport system ATP-binding protein
MIRLRANGLVTSYGTVPVLADVALEVWRGEVLVLLGRNGAGKTTLMRTLIGQLKPSRGRVEFEGADVTGHPAYRLARLGIGYVPQGRGIFAKLTVRENLLVGTRARQDGRAVIPDAIFSYFPILRERIDQLGGTLSGGQQQMLALGRALCGEPKILLLDEPSEGIQPSIVQQLAHLIREVVEGTGISVLLVEQNIDFALSIGARFLIMEKGTIVRQGSADEVCNEAVLSEYLAL